MRKFVIVNIWARLLGAITIIACAAGLSYVISRAIIGGVQSAELRSCQAQNLIRVAANRSYLSDYRFEKLQIKDAQQSEQSNYAALEKIGINRKVLNVALAQQNQSIASEKADAAAKEWIPLTNCPLSVASSKIRAHQPVPFGVRMPTQAALKIGPNN